MTRRYFRAAACSTEQRWHHGGSSEGRLRQLVLARQAFGIAIEAHVYALRGFFLRKRKTVSSSSRYLVR